MRGRIYDIAVDLRRGSPTFGRWYGTELSDENGRILWIPFGFAHGFCVVGNDPADVVYKVDGFYNAKTEGGVLWNDPDLGIEWPVKDPLVSPRDVALSPLKNTKPL
jgi:dTDP-4-dehydrorhamnose 3,5-epimerase